jgi:hypothetical protein
MAYGKSLTNRIRNNRKNNFYEDSSTVLGENGLVWIAFAP